MITRRNLIVGLGSLATASGIGGYAVAIEPAMIPAVRTYKVAPPSWAERLRLRLAVIADLHACQPWMTAERVHGIALQVNALRPDAVLILGDFNAGHAFVSGPVMPGEWGEALAVLDAPLGRFAILGNHDWWHGPVPGMAGGPAEIRAVLRERNITLLENDVVRLAKDGQVFWIAGLADQMAHKARNGWTHGADDLQGTLARVPTDDPVILLAHEPFVFRRVPDRVGLTLCGHTHGGQINLPIVGAPFSPSHRYRYGHIVEQGRHLIVSGGLGESGLPVRLGVPPELLCVELGGQDLAA